MSDVRERDRTVDEDQTHQTEHDSSFDLHKVRSLTQCGDSSDEDPDSTGVSSALPQSDQPR